MLFDKLEIKEDGANFELKINGQIINNVISYSVQRDTTSLARATIEFFCQHDLDLEAEKLILNLNNGE
jgi:hypothetical protein